MYRQFIFEGEMHQKLDCVPLCVRRKLDLAQLKISLEGWQALPRAERLALCHLPVESEAELAVYREVMQEFCARAKVPLRPLQDEDATARTWNAREVPPRLAQRLTALEVELSDEAWRSLDEDARYALFKLSDPKRNPAKLRAACIELGLLAGTPGPLSPEVAVCTPGP